MLITQQLAATSTERNSNRNMSANWQDDGVLELFTLPAEEENNFHITGRLNYCYCHVMLLLLLIKLCPTPMLTIPQLLSYTSHLFCFWNTIMLSKITHYGSIMMQLFGSVKKGQCNEGSSLWQYCTIKYKGAIVLYYCLQENSYGAPSSVLHIHEASFHS